MAIRVASAPPTCCGVSTTSPLPSETAAVVDVAYTAAAGQRPSAGHTWYPSTVWYTWTEAPTTGCPAPSVTSSTTGSRTPPADTTWLSPSTTVGVHSEESTPTPEKLAQT